MLAFLLVVGGSVGFGAGTRESPRGPSLVALLGVTELAPDTDAIDPSSTPSSPARMESSWFRAPAGPSTSTSSEPIVVRSERLSNAITASPLRDRQPRDLSGVEFSRSQRRRLGAGAERC